MRQQVVMFTMAANLAGCGIFPDDSICTTVSTPEQRMSYSAAMGNPNAAPQERTLAASGLADFCVVQAARRYARGPDDADVVADAVVGHCRQGIARVAEAKRTEVGPADSNPSVLSISTGLPSNMNATTFDRYRSLALSLVVEARAGHCRPIS